MTRFLPTAATFTALIFSAGALAAPAMADTTVTEPVTLTYSQAALNQNGETRLVLLDLERQARSACMTVKPILKTEIIDQTCVSDVVQQAVEGINHTALTAEYLQSDTYRNLALNTFGTVSETQS